MPERLLSDEKEPYPVNVAIGSYELTEDSLAIFNAQEIHYGAVLAIAERNKSVIRRGMLYVPANFSAEFGRTTIDSFLTGFDEPKKAFKSIVHLPMFVGSISQTRSPTYEALISYLNLRGIKVAPENIDGDDIYRGQNEPSIGGRNVDHKMAVLDSHSFDIYWYNAKKRLLTSSGSNPSKRIELSLSNNRI